MCAKLTTRWLQQLKPIPSQVGRENSQGKYTEATCQMFLSSFLSLSFYAHKHTHAQAQTWEGIREEIGNLTFDMSISAKSN